MYTERAGLSLELPGTWFHQRGKGKAFTITYGNQAGIAQFLNSLAEGFVQTRLEIYLLFLFVLSLLLIFSLYLVTQNRMAHRELARRSRETLEHLLKKLDLSDEETALLGRLSSYLDRGESEHSLLVSRHVFDKCAQKMRRYEDIAETQMNALRLKIGFQITQPEDVPASSAELPEGSPVLLVIKRGNQVRGTVIAQAPGAMTIKIDTLAPLLERNARLMVYFHNAAGIFSFPTRVTDLLEGSVSLEHSSNITRYQRRRYYRRKEHLPVFIKPASASAAPRASLLLDLGGGGASIQTPRDMLRKGDLLEVSFSPSMGKFTVAARVLRVSKRGRAVGVKFESLSEKERNRIMSFLFSQSERRRTRVR
jgi:PilZ domain